MKKILFALIFLTLFLGASAAPAVTVLSPNGGETVSGTWPITFSVSDAANPQTLNASIFYSSIAWTGLNSVSKSLISATTINLLSSCDFPQGTTWETSDIPNIDFNKLGTYGALSFLNYNGVWVANTSSELGRQTRYLSGGAWINDAAGDYNAGLPTDCNGETWFKVENELYALKYSGCGLSDGYMHGFKYNGTTHTWAINYDINRGFPANGSAEIDHLFSGKYPKTFVYNGKTKLVIGLLDSTDATYYGEYDWNGAGWEESLELKAGLLTILSPYSPVGVSQQSEMIDFFTYKGNLYFLEQARGSIALPDRPAVGGIFSNGPWVAISDLNIGLPTLRWTQDYPSLIIDDNGGDYLYLLRAVTLVTGAPPETMFEFKKLHKTQEKYITSTAKTCTYNWDTTTAANGSPRFVDVNVSSDTAMTVDASNGAFSIANYTTSDLNVTCISNCSASFDSNAVKIDPTIESDEMVFKIKNNAATKGVLYKIANSLQDGRQYWIYSIDCGTTDNCSDYQAGAWVFNSTFTFGTATSGVSVNPVQKIWDQNAGQYDYSFSDPSVGPNKYIYYKLVYKLPIRNYLDLSSEDDWFIQLAPQEQDLNGPYQAFSISNFSNINNYTREAIPAITPATSYYEFQFTAYALGSETISIGAPGAWKSVTLSTAPKRYSVQINDINNLYIKTSATVANTVYFADVVLVERGYFKTAIDLRQENGEPLQVWIVPTDETAEGLSYKYLEEGAKFSFSTKAYDREQKLTKFKVSVFAYTTDDENRVYYYEKALASPAQEYFFDLSELLPPIYLLHTPGAILANKSQIKVSIDLCDNLQCYEQQSAWFYLHNYPWFSNDAMIQIQEENRKLNQGPHGKIILRGRITDNFSAVKMLIYHGSWICSPDMNTSGDTVCNGENSAKDANLAFSYTFYPGTDFFCSGGICDFSYDLQNYYHYTSEDSYYTTFAEVLFKTTDANYWSGRTIYSIGKQPLVLMAEFQGMDPAHYIDENCVKNVGGLYKNLISTAGDITAILLNQPGMRIAWLLGKWAPIDALALQLGIQTTGEPPLNSPFAKMIGEAGCAIKIPATTNIKVVLKVTATDWADLHNYLLGSFRITSNTDLNYISPYYYPTEQFYDIETGENVMLFNTILYDTNGNLLTDGLDYNLAFFVTDQSLRNIDKNTSIKLHIDNSLEIAQPEVVNIYPISLYADDIKNNTLTLRTWVQTRRKYIDKIEFMLYTDKSAFDTLKSDSSNQIIKFNMDASDLLKIEEQQQNLDLNDLYYKFIAEQQSADIMGACLGSGAAGGLTGVAAGGLLIAGAAATATGVGAPIGVPTIIAAIGGLGIFGAVAGCGAGSATAWIEGDIINSKINDTAINTINDLNFNRTREMTIQFKNLQPNDFSDTIGALGIDENQTAPNALIDKMHSLGKKSSLPNIEIYVNGKKFSFENTLVGEGSLFENLKSHKLKLRMTVYYDYFEKSAIQTYDLVSVSKQASSGFDVDKIATEWQGNFLKAFNNYPVLIIGIGLIIAAIIFILPIFRAGR